MSVKNNYNKFLWITTLLIIAIAIWAYMYYIKPVYLFNEPGEVYLEIGKQDSCAVWNSGAGGVFSIELEFTGEVEGIVDIAIKNADKTIHNLSLKGPTISHIYKADWYSDTCYIISSGREDASGSIEVSYRFLEIN